MKSRSSAHRLLPSFSQEERTTEPQRNRAASEFRNEAPALGEDGSHRAVSPTTASVAGVQSANSLQQPHLHTAHGGRLRLADEGTALLRRPEEAVSAQSSSRDWLRLGRPASCFRPLPSAGVGR